MKKSRIVAAVAAASTVVLLAASPVLAVDITVSGNGADSSNTANVSVNNTTNIVQTNTSNINNNVKASANTGGNTANENTGGNTSITTGEASTAVALNNTANSSKVSAGCCDAIGAAISVSGNGADSKNKVSFNINNIRNTSAENNLDINNNVNGKANTGVNNANENTGGNASINTGNANVNVTIGNSGNRNETTVCGCLIAALNPTTPTVTPLPGITPGIPTVLGVTSKTLPNTGYDYPYQLIFGMTGALIGLGLVMKTKAAEIEKALNNLSSKISLG